ncbi:MATE family efflux transporter [Actinomycetospora sp. NBRC 106375]|uniref:MATE family efflux transporter n=1 Tax=Actinomycetospora sp. NBRC 106375 TaxID=3032207 RepID=UPI0024A12B78|nr:MATE family efflux transporter [Actinomycetospora sp. NBRC 106375]GLZ45093.1 MATE family efflux transporter [Actinomycetospora sp. NBRC 106375]
MPHARSRDAARPDDEPGARRVLALASSALVVLVAEPLYLLVDTAVVGHLGAIPLAGLAVGGIVLAQVASLGTFLAYGTTARAARHHGAGDRAAAVREGVAATWIALGVGALVVVAGWTLAPWVGDVLGGGGAVAGAATSWLRIAVVGAPGILVALAGHGWMRGVQDTRRPIVIVLAGNGFSALLCPALVYGLGPFPALGLEGSAWANVVAQATVGVLFVGALARERVSLRPVVADMRAQFGLGRDLLLRSAAFQACFLSATAVAARFGAPSVAAHQIVLQLWMFMVTVLDALAIAAQSLVGAALGAASVATARGVARRVTRYGLVLGCFAGVVFAATAGVLPGVFTPDPAVRDVVPEAWWFFVALQPVAAYVFALDGVLLGAGDAAYLRRITVGSALLAFLPMIWLSLVLGWGLLGIWAGLALFILARAVAVGVRVRGEAWAVTGT